MRKLAADQKLMACLATILLMIAMLGVVSNSVLSHINETFKTAVDSTARKLWLAGDINMAAGNMLAAQRRTILYADTPWAAADARIFEVQAAQVDRDIAELKSLPVNLEELRIIDMVEDSHASYRRVSQHIEEKHVFDLWDRRNEANAYAGIDDTTDQLEIESSKRNSQGDADEADLWAHGAQSVCVGFLAGCDSRTPFTSEYDSRSAIFREARLRVGSALSIDHGQHALCGLHLRSRGKSEAMEQQLPWLPPRRDTTEGGDDSGGAEQSREFEASYFDSFSEWKGRNGSLPYSEGWTNDPGLPDWGPILLRGRDMHPWSRHGYQQAEDSGAIRPLAAGSAGGGV